MRLRGLVALGADGQGREPTRRRKYFCEALPASLRNLAFLRWPSSLCPLHYMHGCRTTFVRKNR